ncbi:MAG: sigma-70 family RNA polymerase sigma factor [Puia sp.]|nr:sigma-70 family RNA polymerase sigma factor [Puia sp.]
MPDLDHLERARLEESLHALKSGSPKASDLACAHIHKVFFNDLIGNAMAIIFKGEYCREEYLEFAKDIVAETFHSMWLSKEKFPDTKSLGAWLTTTCRNNARSFNEYKAIRSRHNKMLEDNETVRARVQMTAVPDPETAINDKLINYLLHYKLQNGISKLPPRQQEVVRLRLAGKQTDVIATEMGLPARMVNKYHRNAVESLRKMLPDLSVGVILLFVYLLFR